MVEGHEQTDSEGLVLGMWVRRSRLESLRRQYEMCPFLCA